MDRNMSLLRANPEALTKKVCVVRDLEIKVRPSKVKKFYPNWVTSETMEAVIRARGEPRLFLQSYCDKTGKSLNVFIYEFTYK